ncbi:MAG: hypothetical protein Fur0018_10940 [Anaerolineales bacterium]
MKSIPIFFYLSIFIFGNWLPLPQEQTPAPPLVVLAPQENAPLQGTVDILIEVPHDSPMAYAGLFFGYAGDPTGTRFPIWEAESPRGGDPLTRWDTTTLSDGNYTLFLTIRLENGNILQATVSGLRVRNYTPIETSTPTPTPLTITTPQPPTPTATHPPLTATPLPPNPAALTVPDLLQHIKAGLLSVAGLFLLAGVYRLFRRIIP